MKGLLIKDLRLMKNMGNSLAIILLVAVGMSFYISDMSFIVIYMAIIGTSFTSSTISYDEFDNGNAFLFSLPVSRKDYVLEKYLFAHRHQKDDYQGIPHIPHQFQILDQ